MSHLEGSALCSHVPSRFLMILLPGAPLTKQYSSSLYQPSLLDYESALRLNFPPAIYNIIFANIGQMKLDGFRSV